MENKKLLLGVILFGWTVLTILILTFAMPVSKKIQRKIKPCTAGWIMLLIFA